MIDEVKETYLEESQEKQIIARTGRSRASSGMVFDVKAAEKKNGPVVVKQLPDLPTVRDRIKYITQGMTLAEIGRRVGCSDKTAWNHLHGKGEMRISTLKNFADAFDVPLEWLALETQNTEAKAKPEAPEQKQNARATIRMHGTFRGEDLPALLPCLPGEYQVSIEVVQA